MPMSALTTRFAFVVVLSLGLMIPLLFVSGLVDERARYQAEVEADVAASWGSNQTLIGPLLVIPETYPVAEKKDNHVFTRKARRVRVYTPQQLTIAGQVDHELRKRALYEVPVYTAALNVAASFAKLEPPQHGVEVLYQEARLVMGMTDTTGIQSLTTNDPALRFISGTGTNWLGSGVQIKLQDLTLPTELNLELRLQGTKNLRLAPVGSKSRFNLASSWPHPSFGGRYLPNDHDIGPQGFTANWQISELARNMPQSWPVDDTAQTWDGFTTADIALFQPITNYSLVDRGTKYALLFIGLTFLAYLCFELRTGFQMHFLQYAVVGAGLVLFFLTLLSLSEHISFGGAYIAATAILAGLISWYTWLVTRAKAGYLFGLIVLVLLVALYTCLYVLLQLEDVALLLGTSTLLAALAVLMYATRDLSAIAQKEPDRAQDQPGTRASTASQ